MNQICESSSTLTCLCLKNEKKALISSSSATCDNLYINCLQLLKLITLIMEGTEYHS